MRRFDLGMSLQYCSQWGLVEAIRELVQNAYDEEVVNPSNTMYFDYDADAQILRIGNKNGKLETSTLLLGKTTKADDERTIGQHGEGYKVATVVLMRLGKMVKIYNRTEKEVWTSKVIKSRRYGESVVVYDIEKVGLFKSVPNHDLIFEVNGVDSEEYSAIMESCLVLQNLKEGKDYIKAGDSRILLGKNQKGRLYVGGLYVTTSKYAVMGYDFEPSLVELDRDRSFIDSIDLQFLIGKVICQSSNINLIEQLKDVWDGSYIRVYAHYLGCSSDMADLYEREYTKFKEEYGADAVAVTNTDEFNRLKRLGVNAIMLTENKAHYIVSASSYVTPTLDDTSEGELLANELQDWFNEFIEEGSDAYDKGKDLIFDVCCKLRG